MESAILIKILKDVDIGIQNSKIVKIGKIDEDASQIN